VYTDDVCQSRGSDYRSRAEAAWINGTARQALDYDDVGSMGNLLLSLWLDF